MRTSLRLTLVAGVASLGALIAGRAGAREKYESVDLAPGQRSVVDDKKELKDRKLHVGLEVVLGFGRALVAKQIGGYGATTAPRTVLDSSRIFVESWLVGAGYDLGRGVAIDVSLPFTYASFRPDSVRLGGSALGNLQIESSRRALGSPLLLALALTLPTAQGAAPDLSAPLDQNSTNAWVAAVNGARARGFEADALFAARRLGLTPRAALDLRWAGVPLVVSAFGSLVNLIDTSGNAGSTYVGEVVAGVATDLQPHKLCTYLFELATAMSVFYEVCPVLTSEGEVRSSRLALCAAVRRVLARGLDLLGIEAPDQM